MKRLNKTIELNELDLSRIKKFNRKQTWLVLTESWCGDAAQTIPIMNKIAEQTDGNVSLRIILRDENPEIMNEFLTEGNRSIPKLIAIDNETGLVLDTWGPRPSMATQMVKDFKAKHGELTPEFKSDLQIWYNKDKGRNTIEDLFRLLENTSFKQNGGLRKSA